MGSRLNMPLWGKYPGSTLKVSSTYPSSYGGNTALDLNGELIHRAFSQFFWIFPFFFQKRTQPWLNLNLYHPSLPLHIFKSPISLSFLEFIPSLLCTIRGCCFLFRDFPSRLLSKSQKPKTTKTLSHIYTYPIFIMVCSLWLTIQRIHTNSSS